MPVKKQLAFIGRCIAHFVYPQLCIGCNKTLLGQEQVLCIVCDAEIPLTHYHHIAGNETAQRFAGRFPFEQATSLAYYTKDGLLQHLLHEFKYKSNKEAGIFLAKKLTDSLKKTDWIKTIDLIIPIPLHYKKSKARGYNQSQIIAEHLSQTLQIPTADHILQRVRNTDTQTRKTRLERLENMSDAFSLLEPSMLSNKHILLLDDVLTTGATIEACALTLLKTEHVQISIATIGIAI